MWRERDTERERGGGVRGTREGETGSKQDKGGNMKNNKRDSKGEKEQGGKRDKERERESGREREREGSREECVVYNSCPYKSCFPDKSSSTAMVVSCASEQAANRVQITT